MSKDRTWLIKLFNGRKLCMIVCVDGYCLNENGKKLFVLQKSAMQMLNDLLDNYSDEAVDDENISKRSIKCNGKLKFETNNSGLIDEITNLIFKASRIKNPPMYLDETISEIERLRCENELANALATYSVDGLIDKIIDEKVEESY